mmetsp:Transcript_18549/g.30912  ORF Transcript_18549/g.30912 Transcript_18549/m.30912 type:complete len:447 (+) Transcript_18549:220-1560(+)|eukprot:CAMPEP_0114473708 /NCGR_PEP_ID=MMETSP0104-20121206/13130_1 /TAXON_ID=37642 ORGANISM="Paraphysomonas imperforata, Strain PA2" /NCGR_SAMPLE_ID=MMETSP0104 /ASSEMBLY_ACC=CAM_ASM_000202 /LENGTH=446 /DNA_ID=CAMNT_0001647919 /DNA_START=128 /DNA_END=1468 /DNA_ORIENTATION=+
MGATIGRYIFTNFDDYIIYENQDDYTGSIFLYDTDFVLDYGWCFPVPGSVMNLRVLAAMIICNIIATVIALCSCAYREQDDDWHFCLPVPVGWANLTLVSVSAFVTIIFTSQLITRWWSVRLLLQGVFGKSNSIVITIAAAFSVTLSGVSREVELDCRRAQQQIYRYLNLGHALMYKSCNKNTDLSDLLQRGVITKTEMAYIHSVKGYSPNLIYSWISILIHRLGNAGLLGDMLGEGGVNMKLLLQDLEIIRANNSMVVVYIKSQLPYSLVQVVAVVVYTFVVQATLVAAGTIGDGLRVNSSTLVFSAYFTLSILCFVFIGLITIYRLLTDPLGNDAADFPKKRYMKACESGYKNLMLRMHNIAPPGELLPGEVAFKDDDITPPQVKHNRYLKKKEKLKNTLWTGEKKPSHASDTDDSGGAISGSLRQLLAPGRNVQSRKEVVGFL